MNNEYEKEQQIMEQVAMNNTFIDLVADSSLKSALYIKASMDNIVSKEELTMMLYDIVKISEILTIKQAMTEYPEKYQKIKKDIKEMKDLRSEIDDIFDISEN